MNIETENFIIKSNKEITYLNEVIDYLNLKSKEILSFFNLAKISSKVNIIIWNDINEYKKHLEQYVTYVSWMCADTFDNNINMLSIEECKKTKTHKNTDINHFKTTIVHEFVHICQQEVQGRVNNTECIWFWEALATNLSNQKQYSISTINITAEELINNFNNLKNAYGIAYTIGYYMLSSYNKNKIIDYVKNPKQLKMDTPKILKETIEYIKNR